MNFLLVAMVVLTWFLMSHHQLVRARAANAALENVHHDASGAAS